MKKLLSFLLIFCFFLGLLPIVKAGEAVHQMSEMEYEVLKLVNRERQKENLHPLTSLPELQRGTDIRAVELVSLTDHTRPDGSPWHSVFYEIDTPPYEWAGENIAAGFSRAVDVMEAWMNSDGHRKNIMHTNFTHMGNAYYYDKSSKYGTHWVQIFYRSHNCQYTSMTVYGMEQEPVPTGTGIDELRLVATLECKTCGSSYLPVLEEYCTGYDPDKAGSQSVTVSALGQNATMNITVLPDPNEQEPTAPTEATEPTEPTEPTPPSEPEVPQFSDIQEGSWYEASVDFMVQQGLMNGVGNGRFNPTGNVTRAMLVTILYRAAGSPSVKGLSNPFKDVPQAWYTDAVVWAVAQGVVTGVKPDQFHPDGNITREQIATILYRYEGSPEAPDTLPPYADNRDISGYALRPLNWAIENGLINGMGGGKLAPRDTATRAQIATILTRYLSE